VADGRLFADGAAAAPPSPQRWIRAGFHGIDPLLSWNSRMSSGIDAGFASLLMLLTAVDAGLGACFFGIAVERIPIYREAFGVPDQFTPIGGISVGYSDEPPRNFGHLRKPTADTVHKGRWGQPT
jgi:nitroreductase